MNKLLEFKWDSNPLEMANEVHKMVRRLTHAWDPYIRVKKDSNDLVLGLYPMFKIRFEESDDPLKAAIRMAIAGNIIDFGALSEFDLEKTIKEVYGMRFAIDDYEQLKEKLKSAEKLLFFTDS